METCLDILILDCTPGDRGNEFCCMLEKGHAGPHYDEFKVDEQSVVIMWHTRKYTVSVADDEYLSLAR